MRRLLGPALALAVVAAGALAGGQFLRENFTYFSVSGTSMEPTLSHGDSVVLRRAEELKPGAIVFFEKPRGWEATTPVEAAPKFLVKRVLAVGGAALEYDGENFLVNGEVAAEALTPCPKGKAGYEHELAPEELFVVGDNAAVSLDSRKVFCHGEASEAFVEAASVVAHGRVLARW